MASRCRVTAAQATVLFLKNQYVERDGTKNPFFAGCFGIFGHGNLAGIGQALQQNPDVILARLDQQKARYQVTIAKDPFVPKLFAGSGAAYTYGYPNSIDGNAPSIVQVKTIMSIYNRPQSFQVAQANEGLRAAEVEVSRRQDEPSCWSFPRDKRRSTGIEATNTPRSARSA